MRRDFEDRLIRLAYEDLSQEEMDFLEAELLAEPEAAACVEEHRSIRVGLRSMADVPQDQLSVDRLRTAILSQGLKPKPVRAGWGWAWMPATAAALALGMTMVRLPFQSTPEPMVVMNEGAARDGISLPWLEESAVALRAPLSFGALGEAFDSDGATLAAGRPSGSTAAATRAGPSALRDRTKNAGADADAGGESSAETIVRERKPDVVVDNRALRSAAEAPVGAFEAPRAESSSTAPSPALVIIEPVRDQSTGAWKATEVENTSNVVIGS
jgi:hypothetical protein